MWHMLRNLDSEQFILRLFLGTKVLLDDKVVREHNGSGPKEDAIVWLVIERVVLLLCCEDAMILTVDVSYADLNHSVLLSPFGWRT